MAFNCGFNIDDYLNKGIIPKISEYCKHDEVINYDDWKKGNIDLCVWKRQETPKIITNDLIEREITRVLRTGVFIAIKDMVIWIPPNYYHFLQYGTAMGTVPEFRLKRLKHVYFKLEVRKNPMAIGTYTIKCRQDGETTMGMNDCLWEVADGNMNFGSIGIQSKNRDSVQKSCWRNLVMIWNQQPQWLRNAIYSDFASGDNVATQMKYMRNKTDEEEGRDILLTYGPSVYNAFDSMSDMRRCVLDEVNKWVEPHGGFLETFLNYKRFIEVGRTRKGLFDIFSSPADSNGKHNDAAYQFWKDADPSKLTETKTTKNKIFRYYSNPLDGVEGFYDKWGDCMNTDEILSWIMTNRENAPADKKMEEIRAYPLDEYEMFGATEQSRLWSNSDGIHKRITFLSGRRFKNDITQEPVKVFGNLEWREGILDTEVDLRISNKEGFDPDEARWCFAYLPELNRQPLKRGSQMSGNILVPPLYIENCLGVDPFNLRYDAKNKNKQSLGGMVNHKFRDLLQTGITKCPTLLYLGRPYHQDIFFEDAIKSAVFCRALVQYENRSDKLANYFEDRGYFQWLLPEIGATKNSNRKGDAPSGKGKFLEEGMGLIDAITNRPIRSFDPYHLDNFWFKELLEDIMKFDPTDTHKYDLTMAYIQALIGAVKIMYKKMRQPSSLNEEVLNYFGI